MSGLLCVYLHYNKNNNPNTKNLDRYVDKHKNFWLNNSVLEHVRNSEKSMKSNE